MPGKRGNAYLLGHTYDSKPSGVGVLDHLKRLHRGKVITIDKGKNAVRFKVTRTERLALHPSEKKMAQLFSHLGRARMTVVTCLWSNSKGRYVNLLVKHAVKLHR